MPNYQPLSRIINMQKRTSQLGFTLIELIIVIVLLGILVAGSGNLLSQGFKSFFVGKDIINANWQASVALERMIRDLHAVRSPSDITTATATTLQIVDLDGNTITYQVTGNQLQRNSQFIANGIQSINFNYYDKNGITTALRDSIRYVAITLNINYNNLTFPVKTAVYLWVLK